MSKSPFPFSQSWDPFKLLLFPFRNSQLLFVNISLTMFVFAGHISLVTPSSYSPAAKITLGTVNSNVGAQMVSVTPHQCTNTHTSLNACKQAALHDLSNTQIKTIGCSCSSLGLQHSGNFHGWTLSMGINGIKWE